MRCDGRTPHCYGCKRHRIWLRVCGVSQTSHQLSCKYLRMCVLVFGRARVEPGVHHADGRMCELGEGIRWNQ
jgi:hypothetical protein